MTLLAFAAAAPLLLGAGHAAVDRYLLTAASTAANPPHAAAAVNVSSWDRQVVGQTDRRTPYRYIDPAAYYAISINKSGVTASWVQLSDAYNA